MWTFCNGEGFVRSRWIWIGAVALCLAGGVVSAEEKKVFTIGMMLKMGAGDQQFLSIVTGAGRGLEGVNIDASLRNQPPIFCQPDKLAVTGGQYWRMLERFVEDNPKFADVDINLVGYALLRAMVDTFPCQK